MNRNIGQTQTFRCQVPPCASAAHQVRLHPFQWCRWRREFTVNIKTADLDQVAQNGQDMVDAYIFAQTVIQHSKDAVQANATKLNLDPEYRKIKLNQTTTRFVVKGYFSSGRVGDEVVTTENVEQPTAEIVQLPVSETTVAETTEKVELALAAE